MIKIPSSGQVPMQPPIPPKKDSGDSGKVRPQTPTPGQAKGSLPLDSHAMAVRLAVLAVEAREKELSMAKIIEHAIQLTGISNPQSAMEEIDRRMQKEIEEVLTQIKSNKELMEEAEAWEALGDFLESNLSRDQLEAFIGLVEGQIKGMK
jgi:hypothetical protein